MQDPKRLYGICIPYVNEQFIASEKNKIQSDVWFIVKLDEK